jgi:two-component system nitrate/nitrite response regulator NarL
MAREARPGPFRVLVADDHAVTRSGLGQLIREIAPEAEVVEAGTHDEVLAATGQAKPFNLVLLDLKMPGSRQAAGLKPLIERIGQTPVVVISAFDSPADIRQAFEHGARGFIPKSMNVTAMIHALGMVLQGETYVPASLLTERKAEPIGDLTPREVEVLALLCEGLSSKEIGRRLDLSEPTVKTHLAHIYRKIGATNRAQAVAVALRLGLSVGQA